MSSKDAQYRPDEDWRKRPRIFDAPRRNRQSARSGIARWAEIVVLIVWLVCWTLGMVYVALLAAGYTYEQKVFGALHFAGYLIFGIAAWIYVFKRLRRVWLRLPVAPLKGATDESSINMLRGVMCCGAAVAVGVGIVVAGMVAVDLIHNGKPLGAVFIGVWCVVPVTFMTFHAKTVLRLLSGRPAR